MNGSGRCAMHTQHSICYSQGTKLCHFSGKQMEMNSIVTSEISQTQTCFLAHAKLVFKKVIIWEEGILGEGKETREGKRGVNVIKVHCIWLYKNVIIKFFILYSLCY